MTAQDTYNLYLYERNVQVVGLRSIDAPILIDTIRTGQESGHSIHNLLIFPSYIHRFLQLCLKESHLVFMSTPGIWRRKGQDNCS